MKTKNTNRTIKILIIVLIVAVLFLLTLIINFISLKNSVDSVMNPTNKVSISTSSNDKTKIEETEEKNPIIEPIPMAINAMPLKMLVNNSWDRIKANLTNGLKIDETNNYFFEDGYTIYCDEINVKNIVFNADYEGKVVGEIEIGTSINDIKSILGTPSFQDKSLGMIGYKTKDLYVFFYKDEISVYSNKTVNNRAFEDKLFSYYYGNYSEGRTKFVLEIKRDYPDFTAVQEGEDVVLRSINRQIEIKLGENKEIEIILYNGYKLGDVMSSNLKENNIISRQQDLAEKQEIERKLAE